MYKQKEVWLSTADAAKFTGLSAVYLNKLGRNGKLVRKELPRNTNSPHTPVAFAKSSLIAYKKASKLSSMNSSRAREMAQVMERSATNPAPSTLSTLSPSSEMIEDLKFLFKCFDRGILNEHETMMRVRELVNK